MPALALAGVLLTASALAALLVADARGRTTLSGAFKVLASTGFLLAAVGFGAAENPYGRALLVAFGLSFLGDVLLVATTRRALLAGLGAFLLAHVAFGTAFVLYGLRPIWTLVAFAVLTVPRWYVLRWLDPHLEGPMRPAVQIYVSIISVMVALAVGASAAGGSAWVAAGALCLYLSDLAVARRRFVKPGFSSRLWGLPLYYAAQLLLAATAG